MLKSLGEAAARLREKLGEALPSIQKFNVPVEQVTTSSLEALKAFSMGREQDYKGLYFEAIPFYKRAIEIDSNFAAAYNILAINYNNLRQPELAAEFSKKAFELRARTSEREQLVISYTYYTFVTQEIERAIEVLKIAVETYPRDAVYHNNLAFQYGLIGQNEKAMEEAREAIRINPDIVYPYTNLGSSLIALNRFDEARQTYEQALARKLDAGNLHNGLYLIAQVRGDATLAQQQIDWAAGKPDEYRALNVQAQAAIFSGQLRKSREFTNRAVDMALSHNVKEAAAQFASTNALNEALLGNCGQAREDYAKALAIVRSNTSLLNGAVVASLCGEVGQAQSLAEELARKNPTATLINAVGLPVIRAAVEIHNNNAAQAVHSLQTATPYEGSIFAAFLSNYIRGQAYLRQHMGAEAAAEFQKILDHRGWSPLSPLYPLAHLGLARAAVLKGDTATARKAYDNFFALWRDADSDIPLLQQAREEYRRLPPV